MDDEQAESIVGVLRRARYNGLGAAGLARKAKGELGDNFRVITLIQVFWKAFEIPLPVLQNAACWRGFHLASSSISDEELEPLLAPWLPPSSHAGQ